MRIAGRLGQACRCAREQTGIDALAIAQSAGVSEPTISRFENGTRWVQRVEVIVEAYERECGLDDGELWRRAVAGA